MKKIFIIAAMALMTLSASAQKIGRVNFSELVQLMPEADEARATLQAISKEADETLQSMYEEYQTKANQYNQKKDTWTPAIREAKEKELGDIQQRLQEFQQQISQELQQQQAQLFAPIYEKAQEAIDIDEDKGRQMADHMKKGKFDFEDYLESMKQMRNMGGLASILGMLPGMGVKASELEGMVDEKQLKQMEAIVLSMTIKERRNPKLLNPQRKHRIAKGAGVDIAVVNRFIKQFEQSQKMMKQFGSMGGKRKGGFGGLGGFGGMGGFPGKGGRFPF